MSKDVSSSTKKPEAEIERLQTLVAHLSECLKNEQATNLALVAQLHERDKELAEVQHEQVDLQRKLRVLEYYYVMHKDITVTLGKLLRASMGSQKETVDSDT